MKDKTLEKLMDDCINLSDNFTLWYPDAYQAHAEVNGEMIESNWYGSALEAVKDLYNQIING